MSGLFDNLRFKIDKPIRLIELFGGIGSQAMALRNIGANFEHYRLVEFDKYAVASYNAIHGTNFETTDIRNVHGADLGIEEKDKFTYLLTYSFPCTDLSVAGKMQGMSRKDWKEGKSTRSGLLWEVERILEELSAEELPDILLMENVPQVHSGKNKADFDRWIEYLKHRGYVNHWKDLNARDYGIPQNRRRCFMLSILSKDFVDYEFPVTIKLEKVMKSFLEEEVEEKFYINSPKARQLIEKLITNRTLSDQEQRTVDLCVKNPREITVANCICARTDRGISNRQAEGSGVVEELKTEVKRLGNIYGDDRGTGFAGNVWDKEGLLPSLTTMQGGGREPTILEQGLNTEDDGTCRTIKSQYYKNSAANFCRGNTFGATGVLSISGKNKNVLHYRIRKLTPRECWRLMGFNDEDYEKAAAVNSNTQLYKQAGNAIVVNVLMRIFSQML